MYHLYFDFTGRNLPAKVTSEQVLRLPKRKQGESLGFAGGCDIALILGPDGETLAEYTYKEDFFSAEAYLNG